MGRYLIWKERVRAKVTRTLVRRMSRTKGAISKDRDSLLALIEATNSLDLKSSALSMPF